MKKIVFIFLILAMPLCKGADDEGVGSFSTLERLASKAVAQKILDGTLDKETLSQLENRCEIKTLAELVAKELYLLDFSAHIDYVPTLVEKHFKGVSIQDLLDNDLLPEIEVEGNIRTLDLQGEKISSLEGYEKIPGIQLVHRIILRDNLIEGLPRNFSLENLISLNISENKLKQINTQLNLPCLRYLDVSWNQLEEYPDPARLPVIQELVMNNNDLNTIPPLNYSLLEQFNVSNNKIATILQGLQLPSLRVLKVRNNALKNIPTVGAQQPVTIYWEGNNFTEQVKDELKHNFPEGSIFFPGL